MRLVRGNVSIWKKRLCVCPVSYIENMKEKELEVGRRKAGGQKQNPNDTTCSF